MDIWRALFQKQMKANDHMRNIYDWSYMFLPSEEGTKIPSSFGDILKIMQIVEWIMVLPFSQHKAN